METLHTQDLGSPILRVLLLPRLKENKEIVEEKDSLVVKSEEEVFDAYFVLHPEKNSKGTFTFMFNQFLPSLNKSSLIIRSFTSEFSSENLRF